MKENIDFFWQIYALTLSEMKSRYRKTIAGLVWVLLSPIIIFSVQAFAFKSILKLQIEDYYLFLLSGLIPWIFIIQSLNMSVNTFTTRSSLLKSFHLNPLILLFASIFDNFINFMIAFTVLLIPVISVSDFSAIGIPFLPLGMLVLSLGCVLVCLLFATAQVFYRDIQLVINFILTIMFFITPIYFTKELMPEKYTWLIFFNPLYIIIEPFRMCLYKFNFMEFCESFFKALIFVTLLFSFVFSYWRRKKHELYLRI